MTITKSLADLTKNLRFFLFSHKGYKALTKTQKAILLELVLLRHRDSADTDMQLALDYLIKNRDLHEIIPYKQIKSLGTIEARYDNKAKLPYITHKDKRLYFPQNYSINQAINFYKYSIEFEDILGEGYRERAPHQYQSELFHLKEGDVLIDAGVAEGLFSLEMIDKTKKIYLVECDPKWWKPLEYTFEPWKDKVLIVKKYLSDKDDGNNIRLKTLLEQETGENIFVKMDIEGYEVDVIQDAKETMSKWKYPLTLSCCTYHREKDCEDLLSYFNEIEYATELSEGYMLTSMNDDNGIYNLRHGIIRASNIKH